MLAGCRNLDVVKSEPGPPLRHHFVPPKVAKVPVPAEMGLRYVSWDI